MNFFNSPHFEKSKFDSGPCLIGDMAATVLGIFHPSRCFSESTLDWIRTSDIPLRRRMLYPTELRALNGGGSKRL